MRKKILTLAVMTTLTLAFVACGQPENGETYGEDYGVKTEMNGRFETIVDDDKNTTPTATTAPTNEPEASVAPTAEPTPTEVPEVIDPITEPTPTEVPEIVEPTTTPAPTATPGPTATPAPTATPEPTKAPVAETKNFETVLRELHSLKTYEEREAYIETLDKSKYTVTSVNCSNETIAYEWGESTTIGRFALIEDCNTDKMEDIDNILGFNEETGEPILGTKELRTQLHPTANDWYMGGELMQTTYIDEYGCESNLYSATPTGECYFKTVTDTATGESDPWGVTVYFDTYNYVSEESSTIAESVTIEYYVDAYNAFVSEANEWYGFYDPMAMVRTWDTLNYYDDIYTPQIEFETGHN